MAAKCKKCDPHEICEECPEWIFTLADLIMCMMGLFVLLWVLKPAPNPPALGTSGEPNKQQERMDEVVGAIRAAFGYVPDPNSSDPVDQAMLKKTMQLKGANNAGTQTEKQDAAEGTDPQVTTIREGKLSAVGTHVPFAAGDTKLTDNAKKKLDEIAAQIVGTYNIVIVKGHASRDDFGESASPQQFMDAALRRAQAAADYLVGKGVAPDILRVQGCSTFEPVKEQAYTAAAQELNRRVEVFTTEVLVRDLQDPHRASARPLD